MLLAADVIVDNDDATGITKVGSWTNSTYDAGYYDANYMHDGNASKGSKSVTFTPTLTAGTWEVFARWTSQPNRASSVPIEVTHAGGTYNTTINEQQNGGTWYSLGSFTFNAGTGGKVKVSNTGTSGYVVADAFKFVDVTLPVTPPAAPSGLTATAASSSQINLSWTDNASDETGFAVDYSTSSTFASGVTTVTAAANATTKSVAGLTASTTYYFRVRAVNGATPSSNSNTANATTQAASVSPIVIDNASTVSGEVVKTGYWVTSSFGTGFNGADYVHDGNTNKGSSNVKFTPTIATVGTYEVFAWWSTNTNRSTNTPIEVTHAGGMTTVNVNQQQPGNGWYSLGQFTFNAGTGGFVRVKNSGTSGFVVADAVKFEYVPPAVQSPDAPTNLSVTSSSSTSLQVAWADVATEDGYELQWSTSSSFATVLGSTTKSANTTSHTITGLTASTTYYLRIRATLTGASPSAWTTGSGTQTQPTPPATPTGVSASPLSPTSIRVTWSDAATEDGYEIEWSTSSTFATTDGSATRSSNATSYDITGLTPATTYYVRVRSTLTGTPGSGWSSVANATTASLPAAPSNVIATAVSSAEIEVTWTDVANENGYEIQYSTDNTFPSGNTSTKTVGANATSVAISGLTQGTTYYVRVRATSSGTGGPWSPTVNTETTPFPPGLIITMTPGGSTVEGGVFGLTLDSGDYRPRKWLVKWGDGIEELVGVPNPSISGQATASHTYTLPGSYMVTAVIIDGNGVFGSDALPVTITPANDEYFGIIGTHVGQYGDFNTYAGWQYGVDLFARNMHIGITKWKVDWGDGTVKEYDFTEVGGNGTFGRKRVSHAYAPGDYQIKVYVDRDGATGAQPYVELTGTYSPVFHAGAYTAGTSLPPPVLDFYASANALHGGINLTWRDSGTEDNGWIIRRTGGSTGPVRIDVPADKITYYDYTAVPGVAYTYTINSVNSVGESQYANAAGATMTLPDVWVQGTVHASEDAGDWGQLTFQREPYYMSGELTISYTIDTTVSDSAMPGSDYEPLSGWVTFLAGQAKAFVFVKPVDDNKYEPTEKVTAKITPGSTWTTPWGYTVDGTVQIEDNENVDDISVDLIVKDPAHPSNTVTATATSGTPTLFVPEGSGHTATINIDGLVTPDTPAAKDKTLWRIDEPNASPSQGGFSSGAKNVTLTVEDNNRTWNVKAGVDKNGNGNLDGNEITRSVTVKVIGLDLLTVSDATQVANAVTDAGGGGGTLYVEQDANARATVNVAAVFAPPEAGASVLWKVDRVGAGGADPANGSFAGGGGNVTLQRDGTGLFTVKAGVDADRNGTLDSGEVSRSIQVQLVEFSSMTVTNGNGPAQSVTVTIPVPSNLFIGAQADGHVDVDLSAIADPAAGLDRILWKVSGNNAAPSEGTFAAGVGHVKLTPTAGNFDFTVTAGFDDDNDGQLDAGEASRTVVVHVMHLGSITVIDSSSSDNEVNANDSTTVEMYLGERNDGTASVNVTAVIDGSSSGFGEVRWKVAGQVANPAFGSFEGGGGQQITLTPTNGNRDYVLTAGADADGDNLLDANEITRTVIIHVVKLDVLTVADHAHPVNMATDYGSSSEIPTLYVEEGNDHKATVDISGIVLPGTVPAKQRVLWQIDEPDASPSQGNFATAPDTVTLTATGNRQWMVKAGFDSNGNNNLDSGEVTRLIKVQAVLFDSLIVSDLVGTAGHVTVTEPPSVETPTFYVGQGDDPVIIGVGSIIFPYPDAVASGLVNWEVYDAFGDTVDEGNFASLFHNDVDITPVNDLDRYFTVIAGFDDDLDGTLDVGEVSRKILVNVVKVELSIFNGQFGSASVAEANEETIGAFTVANLNDTDGDGTIDRDQTGGVFATQGRDEVDLMRLVLNNSVVQDATPIVLKVKSGDVRIWYDAQKTVEVPPVEIAEGFFLDNSAQEFWVEARSASASLRDIVLELSYRGITDTVKATGIWVQPTYDSFATRTPVQLDSYFGDDWVENAGAPRTEVATTFLTQGGTGTFYGPDYNAGIMQYVVVPNIGSVPTAYRPRFDIVRQREGAHFGWNDAPSATIKDSSFFPVQKEYAEYFGMVSTDEPSPLGHLWALARTGVPGAEHDYLEAMRFNFNDFVRISLDGSDPVGTGIKGSRGSDLQTWHSINTYGTPWDNIIQTGAPNGPNAIGIGHATWGDEPLATYAESSSTVRGTRHYAFNYGIVAARAGGVTPQIMTNLVSVAPGIGDIVLDTAQVGIGNSVTPIGAPAGFPIAYGSVTFFAAGINGELVGPMGAAVSNPTTAYISHEIGVALTGTPVAGGANGADLAITSHSNIQAPIVTQLRGTIWPVKIFGVVKALPNVLGQDYRVRLIDQTSVIDSNGEILTQLDSTPITTFIPKMRDELTGNPDGPVIPGAALPFVEELRLGENAEGYIVGPESRGGYGLSQLRWVVESQSQDRITSPVLAITSSPLVVDAPVVTVPGFNTIPGQTSVIPINGTAIVSPGLTYHEAQGNGPGNDQISYVLKADTSIGDLLDADLAAGSFTVARPANAFTGALLTTTGFNAITLTNPAPGGTVVGPNGSFTGSQHLYFKFTVYFTDPLIRAPIDWTRTPDLVRGN